VVIGGSWSEVQGHQIEVGKSPKRWNAVIYELDVPGLMRVKWVLDSRSELEDEGDRGAKVAGRAIQGNSVPEE